MPRKIIRSTLILPVNVPKFVEKAHQRGADAIMLDLEDSVPAAEKESARRLVKDSIPLAAKGGALVQIRVNNDPAHLWADLAAGVQPGLSAFVLPKAETVAQLKEMDQRLTALEKERGLPQGQVKLSLIVETPRGVLNINELAGGPRVEAMSIGTEDYCLELGVDPSADGLEVMVPLALLVAACKAHGLIPVGLMGSVAVFKDLSIFERSADRARQLGCEGGIAIHPDQVPILNRVFSPAPEKVAYSRKVVAAFEEGLKRGTASVNVDGRMVDVPVYKRAKVTFDRAEAIAAVERKKAEALAGKN